MTIDIKDKYLKEIRLAMLIRETEKRLLNLYSEGKLFGTVHTCIGQEFIGISVARSLIPQDIIFSNHRSHGHFLSYSQNITGLIGEIMGKSIGVCSGRGGSQHLFQNNFYSNGIQGGIVPVAAGLAFSQKLKKNDGIAVVFIGDGTLGEGVVYESMNIASKWGLPLLIVCENNLYAQSTPQDQFLSGSILARPSAFGIQTKELNTWDWMNLIDSMEDCIKYVRKNRLPMFCKVDTYRLMAHSKGDDNRSKDEIESYWRKDPIITILNEFERDQEILTIKDEINELLDNAIYEANSSEYSIIKNLTLASDFKNVTWKRYSCDKERISVLIRKGLDNALKKYDTVIIIGEDIEAPYGGAFKCTTELSEKYPSRVINTPISEAAIVGIGNGLALAGLKPVVEIMFGDFLSLAFDQWLNHASKFKWMFNDNVKVPLIIRTPMGGKRGYGPTHSQCLEKHFIGIPGTRVLCLNHRYNPEQLYNDLFEISDVPTLVIENKVLYSRQVSSDPPTGYEIFCSNELFPTIHLRPKLPADITLVSFGGIALDTEDAMQRLFIEEEIVSELFIFTQLFPLRIDALTESLIKTRKLLMIEEGQGFASLSSEIIAQVAEQLNTFCIKCMRVTASENPIPAARPLEEVCLPNSDKIFNYAKDLYDGKSS